MTQAVRNDDSGRVLTILRPAPVHSDPPRGCARPKERFQAPDPDHDPSRVPPGRGNGGFFRRAWRGHGELPDDGGEPPVAPRDGRPGRRLPCNKSGPDRTAGKQEPACGSGHTGTFGRTLRHRMRPDMFHSRRYYAEGLLVPAIPGPPPVFIRRTRGDTHNNRISWLPHRAIV